MTLTAAEFIRANTVLTTLPFLPEMALHLATEITPMWQATESWMAQNNIPPPFWAFAWPGGQGLARWVLDHPEALRGKRVLDFAAGSGLGGIAAAKAGATLVQAADIDPLAQVAIQMNASRNQAVVETVRTLDMEKPYPADVILAGDICYEQLMAHRTLRWLRLCASAGTQVLLADPGRAYVPEQGLEELSRYQVPTLRELEDREVREVVVWRVQNL